MTADGTRLIPKAKHNGTVRKIFMEFLLLIRKNGTAGVWHYADYPRSATLIASGEFQVKADRRQDHPASVRDAAARGVCSDHVEGQREKRGLHHSIEHERLLI